MALQFISINRIERSDGMVYSKWSIAVYVMAQLVSFASGQTLKNPDFSSTDVSAWTKNDARPGLAYTIAHDAAEGHTAAGALKVSVTAVKPDTIAEVKQLMEGNMPVGETRALEGWVKASRTMTNLQFAVQVAESRPCNLGEAGCVDWHWDFVAWRSTMTVASTEWTRFSIMFNRQADTVNFYQVILLIPDTGTVWFDDFAVTEQSSSVLPRLRTAAVASLQAPGTGLTVDIAGRVGDKRGGRTSAGCRLVPFVDHARPAGCARVMLTVQ
jgi:hypothetical protein